MKICYLADGRSIHTMRWIKYFAEKYDVELITLDYTEENKENNMTIPIREYENIGVRVHKIPRKALSMLMSPLTIRALINRIQPDIVHSFFVTHYGFLGACSGFHPLVVSPWGSDIVRDVKTSKLFAFTVKHALRKADVIQCMDESFRDRVMALIHDGSTIEVIYEGVDTEMFVPPEQKNDAVNQVVCLRKSQPPYNIKVLLYAIPLILKVHKNIKFVLLDSGTEIDETKKLITTLGIKNNVFFVDEMQNDLIPQILNSADIYVDTFYQTESGAGIGKTALEAMSCGLPVILANTVGISLHVQHKQNGYIYKGRDANSLANAVIRLIDNCELRVRLGQNARAYVVKYQDFKTNMKRMENCYQKLL